MTAAFARRLGRRVPAAAVTATIAGGSMLLGVGLAHAETREVVCTVSPAQAPAPVTVTEGDQVQLVLVVDALGVLTRVNVGPAQTATPGAEVLSGTVTGVVGLAGQVCRAAVRVQALVTSAVPVPPPPPLPTPPPPPPVQLPSRSVQLPVPGVDVSVQTGGTGAGPGPGAGDPGPGQPPAAGGDPAHGQPPTDRQSSYDGSVPGHRFGGGWMFSFVPWGVSARFGSAAAPAFRFGQQVPGYAPQFGILGAENGVPGRVQALRVGGRATVALPVLLAVLALSIVSGALVRTWVLRHA